MRRKSCYVLAVMLAALGLTACKHDPGIIKYPSPMSNLKQAPHDTTQEDQKSAAQTHTQLAAVYMGQGHLKEAETALNKAVGFDGKYVPAHTLLAILYWRIDRMQDADREFRKAIALDPSNGDTNNNYGRFLCERGNRQDAMKYFQRALADPFYKTPEVANTNAGSCLLKAKDYAAAAPYLHKALEGQPGYGPALLDMAQLELDRNKAFEARGYMQRFESAGQATPQSLLLGYQIATRMGDASTATNYSNRLQDQFPNSPQAQSLNGPNHD
ncbi:MAG TPA: type IV pilus biogenesis/stability protein PilW [Rhodanobacteraceae bacterium]|jgi:type IV pilus assembly protein PilF|nr:type IV pilus biogenesis/stability protein PilW [Rhodanobacteraceae bacterium]